MLRRLAGGISIVLCAVGLSGPALADVTPVSGAGYHRWAGPDRYATAVNVSKRTFSAPVSVAYLVSGETFPDALAAGPLAAKSEGPILLTPRSSLSDVVAQELARLRPTRLVILGGPGAVTEQVATQAVTATGGASMTRLGGLDRYATAAEVARGGGPATTVYLASGEAFPDALASGPVAAHSSAALLLTQATELPEASAAALRTLAPSQVVIVGGTGAVSDKVAQQVSATLSTTVHRIGGRDRFDTAAQLATHGWPTGATTTFLSSGYDFPDALAGSPAAGVNGAPMLLTEAACDPYETARMLSRLGAPTRVVLGGSAVANTGSTTCGPAPTYPFPRDLDCSDFGSRKLAQAWFDYWYPKVGDIYRLDGDKDGKVCELYP